METLAVPPQRSSPRGGGFTNENDDSRRSKGRDITSAPTQDINLNNSTEEMIGKMMN
jgi:hypothetical protein